MKHVVVIDYGIGNVDSVCRAVSRCGAHGVVTDAPEAIMNADGLILPGVGSFAEGMAQLEKRGLISVLKQKAQEEKAPFLGICLGMHLMASVGTEGGVAQGLDLIHGRVVKFSPDSNKIKIPHIGWNDVKWRRRDPILCDIPDHTDFYFVHSYHFQCDEAYIVGTSSYCCDFASVIAHGKCYGTQFHPEKSQRMGLRFLKNFIELC
jgi:glutamine amidotransferase